MKALRFFAREDVRLVDIAEPVCGPEEVKIKVKNCSTCGTDVKILHNGHVNITRVTTMGHEVAGEVVEVGPQALGGFQVGDRPLLFVGRGAGVHRSGEPADLGVRHGLVQDGCVGRCGWPQGDQFPGEGGLDGEVRHPAPGRAGQGSTSGRVWTRADAVRQRSSGWRCSRTD